MCNLHLFLKFIYQSYLTTVIARTEILMLKKCEVKQSKSKIEVLDIKNKDHSKIYVQFSKKERLDYAIAAIIKTVII